MGPTTRGPVWIVQPATGLTARLSRALPSEVQALHRGGVQRVYLGNLKAGSHELVAFFTGGGPHRRDYKRGTTAKFDKGTDPKYIELRIKDSTGKLQPEFDVKIWPGPSP